MQGTYAEDMPQDNAIRWFRSDDPELVKRGAALLLGADNPESFLREVEAMDRRTDGTPEDIRRYFRGAAEYRGLV